MVRRSYSRTSVVRPATARRLRSWHCARAVEGSHDGRCWSNPIVHRSVIDPLGTIPPSESAEPAEDPLSDRAWRARIGGLRSDQRLPDSWIRKHDSRTWDRTRHHLFPVRKARGHTVQPLTQSIAETPNASLTRRRAPGKSGNTVVIIRAMPIDGLLKPERLWTRDEVVGSPPSPVPKTAGVYAWYIGQVPGAIDISRCHIYDGMPMLYVGIAPKKPYADGRRSKTTLHQRVRYHYTGNAEGSTLRLTLGCLLSDLTSLGSSSGGWAAESDGRFRPESNCSPAGWPLTHSSAGQKTGSHGCRKRRSSSATTSR